MIRTVAMPPTSATSKPIEDSMQPLSLIVASNALELKLSDGHKKSETILGHGDKFIPRRLQRLVRLPATPGAAATNAV